MFTNYIKLALRVLTRRKFFSFISLFGISFTLGILMVVLSFLQSEIGTNAPLSNKNDFVLLEQIRLSRTFFDTITIIDTAFVEGVAVYDSSFEYKSRGSSMSQTELNYKLAQTYLSDMPSAERMTIMSGSSTYDVFVNGVKLTLNLLLTDENYWEVFDHNILEGRSFDANDVKSGAQIIVISTKTAQDYFGTQKDVVGNDMFIDGKTYKVVGMYEDKSKVVEYVSPAAVSPYTTSDLDAEDHFYFGGYMVMFQKKKGATTENLKKEILNAATIIPLDHPDNENDFAEVVFRPATYNEMFAQGVYYEEDASKSYKMMKWILLSLLLFFVLLPTLNLINLNVSRIMDRSSEIGVRKAFGAHNGNIVVQFVIENIVQSIIGGAIGLAIALFLINLINRAGYLGDAILSLNGKFFLYSLIATVLFGILSGFIPAFKMSRLHIVNALKESKL